MNNPPHNFGQPGSEPWSNPYQVPTAHHNSPSQPPPHAPLAPPEHWQPHTPPPHQPPVPTRKKSKATLWIALVGIVLILIAGIGGWGYLHYQETSRADNEAAIRQTITDFVHAIDHGNVPSMLTLLCDEEVQQIKNDDDYDSTNTDTTKTGTRNQINVTEIHLDKNSAHAVLYAPPSAPVTLSLTKESGKWKLCNLDTNSPQ